MRLTPLLAVILLAGCVTTPVAPTVHKIPEITMLLCDESLTRQIVGHQNALGAARPALRMIWVRRDPLGRKDKFGDPLPDFEILGHEVWHCVKGEWHD